MLQQCFHTLRIGAEMKRSTTKRIWLVRIGASFQENPYRIWLRMHHGVV